MAAAATSKKVPIEVFEADLETIRMLMFHAETDDTAEGIRYALNIMAGMADRIKELQEKSCYVETKAENWRQAQMRKALPFYG